MIEKRTKYFADSDFYNVIRLDVEESGLVIKKETWERFTDSDKRISLDVERLDKSITFEEAKEKYDKL